MTIEHISVEHVSNIFSDAAIYLSFHSQVLLLHSLLQEQVKGTKVSEIEVLLFSYIGRNHCDNSPSIQFFDQRLGGRFIL